LLAFAGTASIITTEEQAMAMSQQELVDTLSGLALFADLSRPQVEQVAHQMTEESYPAGQRILRQGFTGTGFYVIVDGEVIVRIDGQERARLSKGDFFGEMSILLGEPPVADIVTTRQLRVLHLGGPELEGFLRAYPPVMYRMLKTIALRLRNASLWRG
jgi:CRP-like cAMP-binding protein